MNSMYHNVIKPSKVDLYLAFRFFQGMWLGKLLFIVVSELIDNCYGIDKKLVVSSFRSFVQNICSHFLL